MSNQDTEGFPGTIEVANSSEALATDTTTENHVLLGVELTGTFTVPEIYSLESQGLRVEPTGWGVAIYGPGPQNEV